MVLRTGQQNIVTEKLRLCFRVLTKDSFKMLEDKRSSLASARKRRGIVQASITRLELHVDKYETKEELARCYCTATDLATATKSVTSFLRLHGRHNQDRAQPTTGQNQENQSGNSKIAGGGACLRPLTFTTFGENECNDRSHTLGPAVFFAMYRWT